MMNRRRLLLMIAMLVVAAVLASFMRDVIYQTVVLPLAYLWWLFKFYYFFLPQLLLWILLLVGLFVIILSNFVPTPRTGRRNESKHRITRGQVEEMARLLARAHKGNYFKWQIANRLGRIARGFSEMPDGQSRIDVRNEAVEKYLEAGVATSFVDYPRPAHLFQHPAPTILDSNPKDAVDYLESQLESERGRHP